MFLGEKMFSKRTVYEAHLVGKKHLKALKNSSNQLNSDSAAPPSTKTPTAEFLSNERQRVRVERISKEKQIRFLETMIRRLLGILQQERNDTRANVERKQALTLEELSDRIVFFLCDFFDYRQCF